MRQHTAIALLILFAACSKNPDNPMPPSNTSPAPDESTCWKCYYQIDTAIRRISQHGKWEMRELEFLVERPTYHSDIVAICDAKLKSDYPQYYQYKDDSLHIYGDYWHYGIENRMEWPCDYKSMKKWMELVDKYEG